MPDVVDHDFGKKQRDAARAYGRLTGLLEAQAEAFIRDPSAFFEDAGNRIMALDMVIRSARNALRPRMACITNDDDIRMCAVETIRVSKDEWDRLQKCADIVRAGPAD